jgi:electron transfer flavoprotein alpha subunit
MSVDKIWVLAEVADGAPITTSLELLTQARALAGTVEAVAWGDATASVAGTLGEYGATTVHDVGDLGGALPGAPVASAIAAATAAGGAPDAILFPATYDGRDIAARLSVKLDRPVLTNVVDLNEVGGGLVTQHAIFGGSQMVTARFTAEGPGIFVIRAKSFAAEPSGGSPAAVVASPAPDTGATGAAKVVAHHVEERTGPKLDGPTSWCPAVGAWGRRTSTPSSRSWPRCSMGLPGPAAPSWTPGGCPTRIRSGRPERR